MFGGRFPNGFGLLASAHLALQRGEPPQRVRRPPAIAVVECPGCGWSEWDGASEHPWRGVRFARPMCYGQAVSETCHESRLQGGTSGRPDVAELVELAENSQEPPDRVISTQP